MRDSIGARLQRARDEGEALDVRAPRVSLCAMVLRLRLGTVPYLNAQPLIAGLVDEPGVVLEQAVPSRLVTRLREGTLDAALVSAVELFRSPPLAWVPGPAITSAGPVRSILLFVRGAPARVRHVALDGSSRSAAVLARVCLAEFLGARDVRFSECAPDVDLDASGADAVLRIGDPALATAHARRVGATRAVSGTRRDATGPQTGPRAAPQASPPQDDWSSLDLGEVWTAHTSLPFVYALWVARPGVAAEPLRSLLLAARARGLPQREALADAFSASSGLPRGDCRDYLLRCIGYDLGPAERAGLAAFGALAHRHGLVDSAAVPAALGESEADER